MAPISAAHAATDSSTAIHRHQLANFSVGTCHTRPYIRPRARAKDVPPSSTINRPTIPKAANEGSSTPRPSVLTSTLSMSMPNWSKKPFVNVSWLPIVEATITTGSTDVNDWAASVMDRSAHSMSTKPDSMR